MYFKLVVFIVSLYIAGCASPQAVPAKYDLSDDSLFVPINLNISAGQYVSTPVADVVNYLSDSINKSGQFSIIERSFLRWPNTVEIDYSWEQPMNAAEYAGTMISAGTLLIIPGFINETHYLDVTVYEGDTIIKRTKYETEIQTALSLWHDPIEDRKNAINVLLEDMFSDFRSNDVLPTLNEIKSYPEENKEIKI